MKIALFGGSFDPPHNGHIAAVRAAIEILDLDFVYVIPTGQNPFKETTASEDIRFNLATLAFQDIPKVKVLGCEIGHDGVNYTIDTVNWLMEHDEAFKSATRYLLIGNDLVPELEKWREYKKLFEQVQPVVLTRGEERILRDDLLFIQTPRIDISSTDIRARIHDGQSVAHLVPHQVAAFIQQLHLYEV